MNFKKTQKEALNQFLVEYQLNKNSKLYRYTGAHFLVEEDGSQYLKAKDECTDIAIDHYEDKGHAFVCKEFGKGISLLSKMESDYEKDGRLCVEIELKDVFDQGGLIYEITSLPAYLKGYYVSLPEGRIKVKKI